MVVNPGGVGTCVNQTNLNIKDGEVLGYTFNQIILSSDVPEDPEVKAILAASGLENGEVAPGQMLLIPRMAL